MSSIYESTISPILEAAKKQGASDVFMTGGVVPFVLAGVDLVRLEGHPPVRASDLELFLQEFGFGGLLEGAIRFYALRTAGGDAAITFRLIQVIPPVDPGNSGDLADPARSGRPQADLNSGAAL